MASASRTEIDGWIDDKNPLRKTMNERMNPTALAATPTRRQLISQAGIAFGSLAIGSKSALAQAAEEISRTAESIHQEPVINASRKRVYEVLTDTRQFNEITKIAAAKDPAISLEKSPTVISHDVGGAFSLFGGIIVGRQIELVPNTRIVQAWRVRYWDPGVYSIAKFVLVEQGSGTKIVFDHTGFPRGDAETLASGWKAHYWEPLAKLLG
jgi:activator of HSP90 ATPase